METAPAAKPPNESPVTAKQETPQESDDQNTAKPGEAADTTPAQSAPAQPQPERPKPERSKLKPRPASGPQGVLVNSDPPGATAMLDASSVSCKTPCTLSVIRRHTVSINQSGYQQESREVNITDSPYEVPLITLRAHGGTLMVTSSPVGSRDLSE